jgi:hypothetical protein
MVEAGTLCTNGDVEKKSGLNANATADAEAYTNVLIKEAEGFICASARYDFVTNYATLSTIGKEFLRDVASSLAAIKVINYDMVGFTSRTEAQTMLDINYAVVVEGINLLRDDKYRDFIKSGVVS